MSELCPRGKGISPLVPAEPKCHIPSQMHTNHGDTAVILDFVIVEKFLSHSDLAVLIVTEKLREF